MNKNIRPTIVLPLCVLLFISTLCSAKVVNESARDIPVAYEVDVVVVGGTSAGVAAAIEAAQNGSKVFLAAQRPYLGEDLCGTYRMWLENNEKPQSELAKELFALPVVQSKFKNSIPFTYTANLSSNNIHKDSTPLRLLTDGKFQSASSQSVQYDGSVTITTTLPSRQDVEKTHILLYQRNDDFEVDNITVSVSDDNKNFKPAGNVKNTQLGQGSFESSPIVLSVDIKAQTRYIRFQVAKTLEVERILLAEIIIEAPPSKTVEVDTTPIMVKPMQIKHTLDRALIDASVEFLFGCYATDVLYDSQGKPAGIVMANKSGRQAVIAKVIIDATPRADLARKAGIPFAQYPTGLQTFTRIIVGGPVNTDYPSRSIRVVIPDKRAPIKTYTATEYSLQIKMPDNSFATFAKAEQIARNMTWTKGQVDASETLFQIPPDPMKALRPFRGNWPGPDKIDLNAFRPKKIDRIYILGGCADIPRDAAAKLLRPLNILTVGRRIGAAASLLSGGIPPLKGVHLGGELLQASTVGDTKELLTDVNLRKPTEKTIPAVARSIPVIGEYDVVVIGGGTGGAPAGISAARQGAKTLVVEYLHTLGGVGTAGLISKYYHGNRVGFTSEIDNALNEIGAGGYSRGVWNIEWKIEWYRSQLYKAGGDLWFGTLGSAAFVEDNRVKGVILTTPFGRGVVLGEVIIDSTGAACIAAAAGARTTYTDSSHVAVQGTGLPPRTLGSGYTNTDYTFVDDVDVIDIWRTFVMSRDKYRQAYDLGQLIDTRERRRIVGDFTISPLDIWNGRTYPDTIVLSRSNFDTHGFTVHPVFTIRPPDRTSIDVQVPYRALLPKDLDGIIVTGLGISAHRDAMPVIRMQADIQNQGYAMGVAAAILADCNQSTRQLNVRQLQEHLVEKGNLPASILTAEDSFPLPKEKIAAAVKAVVNNYDGIQIVLVDPRTALPLLREAYKNVDKCEYRLIYAHILGMLGDDTGASVLIDAVSESKWDKGWRYTGLGQFGMSMSKIDSYIIAMGKAKMPNSLLPIFEKIKQLDATSEFSHHRAVAVALETMADKRAAKPLYDLLSKSGMTGHAYLDITTAMQNQPTSGDDTTTRNKSLTELILARALYRCGDYNGLGKKILEQYARDYRGHYARHASAVLKEVSD